MSKRLDNPIRLSVLAIFIVIAYGVLPLISVLPLGRQLLLFGPIILPFNGSIQILYDANGDASFTLVFISLLLGIISGFGAVLATLDVSLGRVIALIFVTADVIWWTLLVVLLATGSESPGRALFESSMELAVPPLWLAFVWWNYTRPEIGAYYRQQAST